MKYKLVFSLVGKLLIIIGVSMLIPMMVAIRYSETDVYSFLIGFVVTSITGIALFLLFKSNDSLQIKEGFALVTISWLIASVFGCIPYITSGYFTSVLDAFFETLSGFTATGVTILDDIESMPKSMLLWRSLTQWLGGMGIIVLFVALLSNMGIGAMQLYKAELTGPVKEKIRPRISDTAKSLWFVYVVLTLANFFALWICGMNGFDAINHALTTIATGGYSTKNDSLAFFTEPSIQWVTIVFMFVSGLSFASVFRTFANKDIKVLTKNSEIKLYIFVIIILTTLIGIDLWFYNQVSLVDSIRLSLFNVVSLITTTGFIIYDYENWSHFIQTILLFLMFTGACAGSTSGGIKIERILILLKQSKNEFKRIIHPRLVISLKIDGNVVPNRIINNIAIYIFLYIIILVISTIIASAFGLPFLEAFSTSLTCIGNGGPSFGTFGPTESFADLPYGLKIYDCFLMLVGRLEIYTVLVALLPIGHKHGEKLGKI